MWKKQVLTLMAAAALAGTAIQPVVAQGYDRGGYGYDRNADQYNRQYNNPSDSNQYNRYPDSGPDYQRDRRQYEADQRAAARWDRDAYYRDCERQRGNAAGGAIAGALVGGLIGNSVSGRDRGAGTAVGAILGGIAGASIASNLSCEDRSYAIDAEFRGFEGGRPHQRYDWHSPRGGAYGYVQVEDYYRDRGRRCANYTEEVWIRGQPETIRGRACRQPDGRWQTIG